MIMKKTHPKGFFHRSKNDGGRKLTRDHLGKGPSHGIPILKEMKKKSQFGFV
jgi:hypothetical protein